MAKNTVIKSSGKSYPLRSRLRPTAVGKDEDKLEEGCANVDSKQQIVISSMNSEEIPPSKLISEHGLSTCDNRKVLPDNGYIKTKRGRPRKPKIQSSSRTISRQEHKLLKGNVKNSTQIDSNNGVPPVGTELVTPASISTGNNMEISKNDLTNIEQDRCRQKMAEHILAFHKNKDQLATNKSKPSQKRKYTQKNKLGKKNNLSNNSSQSIDKPGQDDKPKVKNDGKYTSIKKKKSTLDESKNISEIPNKKARKDKAPPPEEKRLKRERTSMGRINERIERAITQRLFLIKREPLVRDEIGAIKADFVVLGSTGNVYNVSIGRLVTCTCPDHLKGNICKHIIFVMVKVLKQSRSSMHIIQAALLSTELEDMFEHVTEVNDSNVLANDQVRKAIVGDSSQSEDSASDERRPIGDDDDCPVCFDNLKESSEAQLVWCKEGCGKSLHKQCWTMWKSQGKNTCVYCRREWREKATSTGKNMMVGREGYVNAGHLQGQGAFRDTSTYSKYGWHHRK